MTSNQLSIMLIGDSITEGFNTSLLPQFRIINRGVSGDGTVEALERIKPDWFNEKPDMIFICIGTNDIDRGRTDEFIIQQCKAIVDKIAMYSPHSAIILTSLFPTRNNPERANERIVEINKKLNSTCFNSNIRYFQLHDFFTDKDGKLKRDFTDDGLHLNTKAYEEWAVKLFDFISLININ